jgi:NADPH-dependent ferric siderophore reductase
VSTRAAPVRRRQARLGEVVRTSRVTPHMIRVVLGGSGLAGFDVGEFTDHYVKLLFPPAGAEYSTPFDVDQIHAERPRSQWPVTRSYTVRAWDADRAELTVDFVYHGDHGLAGPWAAAARPGDVISFFGPGGGYAPDPQTDWHLLVGDESALPAIAATLGRLPEGVAATVVIEVEDEQEHQLLESPGLLDVTWVDRLGAPAPVGAAVADRVRALRWPGGDVQAFVHGEASLVKEVRHHLRFERGVPRERLSASGYWRRGLTDEGWRATKKDWTREVERDEQEHTPSSEPGAFRAARD